jgi:hypothetical protein
MTGVLPTHNSEYIVSGIAYNQAHHHLFIMRIDVNGTIIWQKCYNVALTLIAGYTMQIIKQTPDQGYIISGTEVFPVFNFNTWLIKVNEAGDIQWSKIYTSATRFGMLSADVEPLQDGSYIASGNANADMVIFKLDQSGNIIWQKIYGGNQFDMIFSVKESGSGYIAAGYGNGLLAFFGADLCLLKIRRDGTIPFTTASGWLNSNANLATVDAPYTPAVVTFSITAADASSINTSATVTNTNVNITKLTP